MVNEDVLGEGRATLISWWKEGETAVVEGMMNEEAELGGGRSISSTIRSSSSTVSSNMDVW